MWAQAGSLMLYKVSVRRSFLNVLEYAVSVLPDSLFGKDVLKGGVAQTGSINEATLYYRSIRGGFPFFPE